MLHIEGLKGLECSLCSIHNFGARMWVTTLPTAHMEGSTSFPKCHVHGRGFGMASGQVIQLSTGQRLVERPDGKEKSSANVWDHFFPRLYHIRDNRETQPGCGAGYNRNQGKAESVDTDLLDLRSLFLWSNFLRTFYPWARIGQVTLAQIFLIPDSFPFETWSGLRWLIMNFSARLGYVILELAWATGWAPAPSMGLVYLTANTHTKKGNLTIQLEK